MKPILPFCCCLCLFSCEREKEAITPRAKAKAVHLHGATTNAAAIRSQFGPTLELRKKQLAVTPAGERAEALKTEIAGYEKSIADADAEVRKAEKE